MLIVGLLLVWLGGSGMLGERFPNSSCARAVNWAGMLFLVWMCLAFFGRHGSSGSRLSREDGFIFLTAVCAGLIVHFANPPLAVSLLGALGALQFLGVGLIRGRLYHVAAAGWLVAALAARWLIAWSGTQLPYAPLGLIGGIGTAIQGTWELARSLRQRAAGTPPQFASTPRPAGAS